MNDELAHRVRSAAIAGWWTLLIASLFLAFQWVAYLIIMNSRPDWLLRFWGGHAVTWTHIQATWIEMTAAFKLIVWVGAMIAIWLTLWARGLRKA